MKKKYLSQLMSVILSATVMTSALPFMASASYDTEDYNVVVFEENFDGKTSIGNKLTYKEVVPWNSAEVVSAAEKGLEDAEIHGDVVEVAKSETTQEEVGYNKDGSEKPADGYFRIHYKTDETNIDTMFANSVEFLKKVKATFDICPNLVPETINVRFLDTISGSSTKGSTLIFINQDGYIQFLNGGKIPYEVGKWYSFEVYLDFETDTYTAYVNGKKEADKCAFSNLTECINSFGLQYHTHGELSVYMDNMSFAVPASSLVPDDTNTVWENDFEKAEVISGVAETGTELTEIDYRPENCTYSVVEESGNKYYSFYPIAGKVANSGNFFQSGYFKTTGTNLRGKKYYLLDGTEVTLDSSNAYYYDADGNKVYVSSSDVTSYPIDVFPIDQLRFDMSLKLDNYINTSIRSYYYGMMHGAYNSAWSIVNFHDNGNISLVKDTNIVGTYTPGEWMDIAMYLNYKQSDVTLFIDGEFLGIYTLDGSMKYSNQIRVRTATADNSSITDMSQMKVSIDNIRYSTTYNQDYIDRKMYEGYTVDIAGGDFEEFNSGDGLYRGDSFEGTSIPTVYVNDSTGNTIKENISNYYVKSTKKDIQPVTVIYDGDKESNVARINESNSQFGIGRLATRGTYAYENYGKYPSIVKIEADMMKTSGAAYLNLNELDANLITWFSANHFGFANGPKRTTDYKDYVDIKRNNNEWVTFTLYLDFNEGKYTVFIDGEIAGKYRLPANIKDCEFLTFKTSVAGSLYVDNISISTIEPFGGSKIAEYKDAKHNAQLGYVINNTDDTAYNYGVYCAKYTADGTLIDITTAKDSVAAGTMEFKNLSVVEAEDGGYYTYFVWEDLVNLKPLFESKTIR